jgi:hypothetical protein
MEIAYSNNEANKFNQEVNGARKGFKPQTWLIRGREGNIVNNKEKVLQRWSENYEKTLNCKMEQTMTVEKSGQCVYKLQNRILNHQIRKR